MFGRPKIPSTDALTSGLSLDQWPTVVAALARQRELQGDHERARQRLAAAVLAVEQTTSDARFGRASIRDLEAALVARQAAALVVNRLAGDVNTADVALKAARLQAAKDIGLEAVRRRDTLQVIADGLRPELDRLRDAELTLDRALAQLQRDVHAATGQQLGGPTGVPPLDWPGPLTSGWPG